MKLLDDWKQVLKTSWSVRLGALSATATSILIAWPTAMLDIWNVLPDSIKAFVPQHFALSLPLVLMLASIWARVLLQKKADGDSDE